jgi:hypothetical protein
MTSEYKSQTEPRAATALSASERRIKVAHALSLECAPAKAAKDQSGSDPYNTSGSFDRKKNWARVGKR